MESSSAIECVLGHLVNTHKSAGFVNMDTCAGIINDPKFVAKMETILQCLTAPSAFAVKI